MSENLLAAVLGHDGIVNYSVKLGNTQPYRGDGQHDDHPDSHHQAFYFAGGSFSVDWLCNAF
jgi:hypothetical protein